jgi:30S ribosomal protein S31
LPYSIKKSRHIGGIFYFRPLIIQTNTQIMGRGDKKTAKGKRFKGSFGKSRPRKVNGTAKKTTTTSAS